MLQGLFKRQLVSKETKRLGAFTTDAAGQLDVLGHDGDTFGVDGAQVGVFEEADKVGFRGFLKGKNGRPLESKVGLEVLGDLSDKSLEWKLSDQKLGRLLVSSDLSKSDGTWTVSVWLLDSSSGWGRLSGSLGSKLLSWGLSSGGLSCGLFSSSHFEICFLVEKNEDKGWYRVGIGLVLKVGV